MDPREARLPRWAQDELAHLRQNLKEAHARLAAGPADSDTFASPYDDLMGGATTPLGQSTTVRYGGPGLDNTFDARWDGSELVIQYNSGSLDRLAVMPQSSNTIRLTGVRRGP